VRLREICCDSCPLSPTCEEENDFLRDIGLADDEWGEECEELCIPGCPDDICRNSGHCAWGIGARQR
jgi:hypothetical protein